MDEKKPVVDVTLDGTGLGSGGNDPRRAEELRDLAFGMFIHWSVDCGFQMPMSHWMCAADRDIIGNFIKEWPGNFYPREFVADDYARLAKQVGMKYTCFTTKHHNGFCMFNTKSTEFNVMNSEFGRDIAKEFVEAFRCRGIEPGFYFSPIDFYWSYTNGRKIHFLTDEVHPLKNPDLMEYNKQQVREILSQYGDIRMMFFDGPPGELKSLVWAMQPGCTITRGEVETPEQVLPEQRIEGLWEANYTIGSEWNFKPTNDKIKTGSELIELLITTRARGGNLLLNVSPDRYGRIPFEQERVLLEVGQFVFFNAEAIYKVRPWYVEHEGNVWFTKAKDENTVYAFLTKEEWTHGFYDRRKTFTLKSVRATEKTTVEVLGQSGEVIEHRPWIDTKSRWTQDDAGLHIDAVLCLRNCGSYKWPNPNVVKITHVEPGTGV